MGQDVHFVSIPFPLSQGERGMGRLSHILFLLVLSLDKVNLTL